MSKRFVSTKTLVRCIEPGKRKTADSDAVAPKVEEIKAGTIFQASDFTKEEFVELLNNGDLVEDTAAPKDEAAAYYDSQASRAGLTPSGELKETEAQRLQRLQNEARTLGISFTKTMKADTIEAKIAEEKNKRPDGTTPSVQTGAGRENPSEGTGPAGGLAEGTADGADPAQGQGNGESDESIIG